MGYYATEQGGEHGRGEPRLDTDLKPHLREEYGLEVFLTEFPYYQYAGLDYPPRENEDVSHWMDKLDAPFTEVPSSIIREGPYRTDLVGVSVNTNALRTRYQRLGHFTPMNQPGSGKRRNRRTYLTFMEDGPMRREYWENEHGGPGEIQSYGESTARTAFGWLKKRHFLVPVGGGAYDAVQIPLHVEGRVHAFELKLSPGEWGTALEQASRADCYADYRWVVMSEGSADLALQNTERFQSEGVGLITVHPEDGATTHVWPEKCTRELTRDMMDRYMVERWDVNERVLRKLQRRYENARDSDYNQDMVNWDTPDILATIPRDGTRDPEPPTSNGFTATTTSATTTVTERTEHKPLTEYGGGQ